MRRLALLLSLMAVVAAAATIAGGAGAAGKARRVADQGFAGGGYVTNSALPGDPRVRFTLATRESQATGVVRGVGLQYRVQGFDLQRWVIHSTSFDDCSLVTTPGAYNGGGSVTGWGDVYTVNTTTGVETLQQSSIRWRVSGTDNADPGDGVDLVGVELTDLTPTIRAAIPDIPRDSFVTYGNMGVRTGPDFC